MLRLKSELGSAILEFITFVMVGQVVVFGATMALANQLSTKVELQIAAANAARSIALGRDFQLPTNVSLSQSVCLPRLVCVTLSRGDEKVTSVSYR